MNRKEAKAAGVAIYTGKPCKHGISGLRRVSDCKCTCERCRLDHIARVKRSKETAKLLSGGHPFSADDLQALAAERAARYMALQERVDKKPKNSPIPYFILAYALIVLGFAGCVVYGVASYRGGQL